MSNLLTNPSLTNNALNWYSSQSWVAAIDKFFPRHWRVKTSFSYNPARDTLDFQVYLTYNGRAIRMDKPINMEDVEVGGELAVAAAIREEFDEQMRQDFPNVR